MPRYSRVGTLCHAGQDGECLWADCPQLRDCEPATTGRHCPLDIDPDDTPNDATMDTRDLDTGDFTPQKRIREIDAGPESSGPRSTAIVKRQSKTAIVKRGVKQPENFTQSDSGIVRTRRAPLVHKKFLIRI